MSREVLNKVCQSCESVYKFIYYSAETSGFPKFCPFCGSEDYEEPWTEENIEDFED